MPKDFSIAAIVLAAAAFSPEAESQTYRAASIDKAGQLKICLPSGSFFKPPKLRDQISFGQPMVSTDHRVVGWLANYPDSSVPQGSGDPVAGRLVLYAAGHVHRSFGTDQTFWSWRFIPQKKSVAFCVGPTHGGADLCELHQIASGRLLATWKPQVAGNAPFWVAGLNY